MHIGEAVNDPEGTCWGAYGVANALARSGNHDEAHQYMQRALGILSERSNIVVIPTALQTYGFVHMQSGDYQSAQQCLEESCRSIGKEWAFVEYAVRAYPLLVESLLGPRWFNPEHWPDANTVKRSWKLSRVARFWAWRFPNYMPHALRVRGRAAWVSGKRKKATECFQRSIQNAESIGAMYDVARSCDDIAKTDVEDKEDYQRRAREILQSLNAVLPVGEAES
jgi:tetratricopeptide (TPR) repeat protein